MELQALLVLCGVGVAGVAVLLLMGLFSTSGTSYEEAIAQQRKAATELLALAVNKSKPKKNNKKAIKKQAKKDKKDNALANGSELESEAPAESGVEDEPAPAPKAHVEFSPPVVVDVPRDTPPNVKPQEKVEEVLEKKEPKAAKPAKVNKSQAAKPAPVEPKEEVSRERHNSGDGPKEQRKAKKVEKKVEKNVEEVVEVREEVVPPLNAPQPSELTTEKLLKQAMAPAAPPAAATPPPGKKKKKNEPNVLSLMAGDGGGVNVGELVRVVREAALSRTEIQILTDALLNKHHDPLPEHSEWTEGPNDPMQKLKKQLADKEKALADEVEASQALHNKLKELRATLNAERRSSVSAVAAARAAEHACAAARADNLALQARVQRLLDDNHALAQAEGGLAAQAAALQAECGAVALEAARARDQHILAQQHAADLAHQLTEANRAFTELEQQRQLAIHAEQIAQQELRNTQERLLAMTELQNEVQRLTSRAEAAEGSADRIMEEAEKQKLQLSNELSSLREQLSAAAAELAELRQLTAAPAHNGLPAADPHKAAELAKVESVVERLRGELEAAQRGAADQRDQIAALARQLQRHQDKNNEALTKAQEAQYNEVATILRAVCPSAAPTTNSGKDWLQTFAENLKKEFQKRDNEKKELEQRQVEKKTVTIVEQAPPSDERVNELKSQNEQLQSLVDKYKRIIDDTEGVLSRLQQNVTTEEQRWARQLADKQSELDSLRRRTVQQLQNKIDSLEAQLAQARTNNHNHSFADAERMTEERLMGGLSDKLSGDVCNGPSQVGLEK